MIKKFKFINKYLVIFIILIIHFILSSSLIENKSLSGDSWENYNIAYNIYSNNSFSITYNNDKNISTNYREPLYPLILSLFINLEDKKFNKSDEIKDEEITKIIKKYNIIFSCFLIFVFWLLLFKLDLNLYYKIIAIFLISFGHYLSSANVFLTETFASSILLIHSFFLFKYIKKKSYYHLILSYLFLIILIFIKNVFLYWIVLLNLYLIYQVILKKIKLKNLIIIFIIFLIPFMWNYRNFIYTQSFEFTSNERSILALSARVNLSNLTYNEYFSSYFYYNPFLKNIFFRNDYITKLDDTYKNGYYLNSHYFSFQKLNEKLFSDLNINEKNKIVYDYKNKQFNKFIENNNFNNDLNPTLIKILVNEYFKNFDKNILLIPSTIFRMSNLNSGNSIYYLTNNNIFKFYILIILILSQIIFLMALLRFLFNFKENYSKDYIYFVLPSLFYLLFYSIFSMGLPRFGLVIFPSLIYFLLLNLSKNNEL